MAISPQIIAREPGTGGRSLVSTGRMMLSHVLRMGAQPGVRRAMPAMLIVAVAVIGFAAIAILRQPQQMTLYAGLPEAEKAAVIDALVAAGIAASLNRTTGAVQVANTDFHRARVTLAGQGLPESAPSGYDSLADMPMGTSRSVEAARLRQAQELELARSIAEISTVKSARVHLAIPKASAFVRDPQSPSASVFVKVAAGRVLDTSQVAAIVNLVSSSVPKMARKDVTVVDQTGRLLSRGADNAATLLSDQQLQHRIRIEDLYRNRIEALVGPIVGLGNFTVRVNVDMDFTQSEITEETVDPQGNALRSEQETLDLTLQPQARGIPGAVSNRPPPEAVLSKAGQAGNPDEKSGENPPLNKSSSATRNYEVSRTVQTTRAPASKVVRIDAAILLRQPETAAGKTTPVSDQVLQDVEQLARSAIGFDETRGDSVTISSQPFVTEFEGVTPAWYDAPWVASFARQSGLLLALAIIAIGVIRPLINQLLVPISPLNSGPGDQLAHYGLDSVEVSEGESLDEISNKLQPKSMQLAATALENAGTYDEKVAIVRQIVSEESNRVASVFQAMMQDEMDTA